MLILLGLNKYYVCILCLYQKYIKECVISIIAPQLKWKRFDETSRIYFITVFMRRIKPNTSSIMYRKFDIQHTSVLKTLFKLIMQPITQRYTSFIWIMIIITVKTEQNPRFDLIFILPQKNND